MSCWGIVGAPPVSAVRKILKVVCDPHLAVAILNAQVSMRGKAPVPLSVRLHGRVHFGLAVM